ncbi:MAG: hypothetical protein WDW38_001591 [Sanguina aurantia]
MGRNHSVNTSESALLPPLPKLPAREAAGPTPWSNWVIPGRVIAGAYPASLDDAETERILSTMLELGMNTFVCLQAEVNINTPEHAWRAGHGLRPYIKDAQKILSKAHETGSPRITQQKIDFLHLPIIDGNVTTDSALNRLAEDVMERVVRGEKLYIHCWGGHGRTGTLVAVMLGRLYGLPYTTALRYTQAFHDARVYPQGVRSPQTPVQRAQVRPLLALLLVALLPRTLWFVKHHTPLVVRRLLASPSAVTPPTPAPLSSQASRQITPIGRSLTTSSSGNNLMMNQKPLLGAALGIAGSSNGRPGSLSVDVAQRPIGAPPGSPMRSRPLAGTNQPVQRYASPMKGGVLDSRNAPGEPLRAGGTSGGPSTVDRLSSDLSRMAAPSASSSGAAAAASSPASSRGLPLMQPRAPSRGTSATALSRRPSHEVNVR